MSFPYHDPYWSETAKFLALQVAAEDKVLAPDDFWRLLPRIYRYINTRLKPEMKYDWAVIHKGQLGEFAPEFLRDLVKRMLPVYANEVFVVWSGARGVSALRPSSTHVRPMMETVAAAAKGPLGPATQTEGDHVLPDPGSIFQFGSLTIGELREAMDAFWRNGGYLEETFRDHAYSIEIDSYVTNFLGDVAGRTILDVCCGAGRLPPSVNNAGAVVGIDISKVALDRATAAYSDKPAFKFAVMDAHALGFAPASFDIVTFTEAIEHVHDASRVITEIKRVLKPGGDLLVTTANTNSLHLIIIRKLAIRRSRRVFSTSGSFHTTRFERCCRTTDSPSRKAAACSFIPIGNTRRRPGCAAGHRFRSGDGRTDARTRPPGGSGIRVFDGRSCPKRRLGCSGARLLVNVI